MTPLMLLQNPRWTGRHLSVVQCCVFSLSRPLHGEKTELPLHQSPPDSSQSNQLKSCLVAKLCLTLCNPWTAEYQGFPVLHYLLEFTQTHVH